jgi:hypothetical protein
MIRVNSLIAFFASAIVGDFLIQVAIRMDRWIQVPQWLECGMLLIAVAVGIGAWFYVRKWLDALDDYLDRRRQRP